MKRLFAIMILTFIPLTSFAGTVTVDAFVSGADVTISHLESLRTILSNEINGNLEGGINIKAASLVSEDFSLTVSPVKRWDESFNDYTLSGMLPATDSDLDSNISAGVSYVSGNRIEKDAEAHTYTASKDTYVYISTAGYLFEEVANGGAVPTTPSGSLLLAKAVTDGTTIASVTDSRVTSINITATTSNFPANFRSNAHVRRDSTTTLHAEAGELSIGTTIYGRTTDTDAKAIATSGNWIEGQVPSLTDTDFYYYAYNNSGTSWDIKFSSADPAFSDVDENLATTLRYYKSGGVTYRAIGWAYASADAVATYDFSDLLDPGTENSVTRSYTTSSNTALVMPADDTIPQRNSEAQGWMEVGFVPTDAASDIQIDIHVASSQNSASNIVCAALFQDTTANAIAVGCGSPGGSLTGGPIISHVVSAGSLAWRNYNMGFASASGTSYVNSESGGDRYGGKSDSRITVREIPT